jgi:hypothetical protein
MAYPWADMETKPCIFCGKITGRYREINPPDDSTRVFKWICSSTCLANWGTGQQKPIAREK